MKYLHCIKDYLLFILFTLLLIHSESFAQTSKYSGHVYGKASRKPVVGAIVIISYTVNNKEISKAISGNDGSFSFNLPEITNIKISVSGSGYLLADSFYTITQLRTSRSGLPVIFLTQASLTSTQKCIGHVYDRSNKNPVAYASVAVSNTDNNSLIVNTISGMDGSYLFYLSAISNLKITVSGKEYQTSVLNYNVKELVRSKGIISDIYLDPAINLTVIKPNNQPESKPVGPQPKKVFLTGQLDDIHTLASPGAFDLIYYLNPGLKNQEYITAIGLPI